MNRITLQTVGDGSTGNQYVYDAHGRLAEVAPVQNPAPPSSCSGDTTTLIVDPYGNSCVSGGGWTPTSHQLFAYDSAGNRTDSGGTYTTGNRITAWGGCSYLTDADGNVTSRTCGGSTVTFTWSAESRLTSYTVGGQTINLKYNAGGQLVRKDSSSTPKSNFLWDGDNLLAEVNAAGTGSIGEYSYYGTDHLHALMVAGTEYNAQTDGLGDVIALTDNSSNVKRTYGYDAWGTINDGQDGRPFTNVDRARWKGALWLGPELDVYYMRNRWYETGTGRFLSEDPIGISGGPNPYTYGVDDPVNLSDPVGLDAGDVCDTLVPCPIPGPTVYGPWWTDPAAGSVISHGPSTQGSFHTYPGAPGGSSSAGTPSNSPSVSALFLDAAKCVANVASRNYHETKQVLDEGAAKVAHGLFDFVAGDQVAKSISSTTLSELIESRAIPYATNGARAFFAIQFGEIYVGGQAILVTAGTEVLTGVLVAGAFDLGVLVGSVATGVGTCL